MATFRANSKRNIGAIPTLSDTDPVRCALNVPHEYRTEEDNQTISKWLKTSAPEVFKDLSGFFMDQVSARVIYRIFQKGEIIFCQGEPGRHYCIVISGLATLFMVDDPGTKHCLTEFHQ